VKLFLQSYRNDAHLDRLLTMAGGPGAGMAIIPNAVDDLSEESRLAYQRNVFDPVRHFSILGFDPLVLDLRVYFGCPEALARILARQRVIYVPGGNCFVLRRAMHLSGLDAILPELLAEGIVYAGWSAGSCVAGNSLRVIEPMDDPAIRGIGHPATDAIFEGLNLIPYGIIPHYQSDHPESAKAEDCVMLADREGLAYRTLRDDEVIVVEDGREELLCAG
jgi:dipeptidase E